MESSVVITALKKARNVIPVIAVMICVVILIVSLLERLNAGMCGEQGTK